ncbi:MAG: TetR family transcriptional regulator [Deferribacterales bacterium]
MTRKQQIIETAIELFNEQGTKNVTTNHIAAKLGISPGSLYYYFKNKEEIIREIFAMMDRIGMEEYGKVASQYQIGTLEAMEHTFVMVQKFNWRFRFFKRELTSLLHGDRELMEAYTRTHQGMLMIAKTGILNSIACGNMVQMTQEEIDLFTEELWLLLIFWLNFLEIGGEEVNDETLARGNAVLRNAIKFRLTEKGLKELR